MNTVGYHGIPLWDAVLDLQRRLAALELQHPGSDKALIIEDAITLLVNGRIDGHPEFQVGDALRRARFLLYQSRRKRRSAAIRLGRPEKRSLSYTDERKEELLEPIDRFVETTPEDLVAMQSTACSIIDGVDEADPTRTRAVLAGLLAGERTAEVATELCCSRSTVDRCIAAIRSEARRQFALASAS